MFFFLEIWTLLEFQRKKYIFPMSYPTARGGAILDL
jgi:hypothetical protein